MELDIVFELNSDRSAKELPHSSFVIEITQSMGIAVRMLLT